MAECLGRAGLDNVNIANALDEALNKAQIQLSPEKIRQLLAVIDYQSFPLVDVSQLIKDPSNNGYMPYVFTVFQWTKQQIANRQQMEADFLKIFESQAGVYPYWFGDSEGLTLVAAIPNTKFHDLKKAPRVISGLTEILESEAIETIAKLADEAEDTKLASAYYQSAVTMLYAAGYTVAKRVDKPEGKPA